MISIDRSAGDSRVRSVKYATIVADPPWEYPDGTGRTLGIGDTCKRPRPGEPVLTYLPYPSLTVEEIAAMPVALLAAEDAHLYLWTTNRYLRDVWGVAEAWGFEGRRLIVWAKRPFGLKVGGTWPSTAEFCLFATRGNLRALRQAPSQVFDWPRKMGPPVAAGESRQEKHSAKPEAFLDLVESISPGPYLELFARRRRMGWDAWGNEVESDVEVAT